MRPHAAEGVLLQVAVGHVQGVGDEAELEGVADAVEVMGEVRGPRLQRRGGPRLCFLQGSRRGKQLTASYMTKQLQAR